MPRVTDQHRQRRRQQILEAARRTFLRKGFHQTSMTDIFEESGLSAGGVYGYFRSKDELIAAIAQEAIAGITDILAPILAQQDPPPIAEAMRQALHAIDELAFSEDGFGRLGPQVWAEAVRDPELAGIVAHTYEGLRRMLADVVVAARDAGRFPADRPVEETSQVLLGTLLGYLLQRLLLDGVDANSYATGLAALTAAETSG